MAAARYWEDHHAVSPAKSHTGDKVLADLVRTERHQHRVVARDSDQADVVPNIVEVRRWSPA